MLAIVPPKILLCYAKIVRLDSYQRNTTTVFNVSWHDFLYECFIRWFDRVLVSYIFNPWALIMNQGMFSIPPMCIRASESPTPNNQWKISQKKPSADASAASDFLFSSPLLHFYTYGIFIGSTQAFLKDSLNHEWSRPCHGCIMLILRCDSVLRIQGMGKSANEIWY